MKKLLLGLLLASSTFSAMAVGANAPTGLVLGVGYMTFEDDEVYDSKYEGGFGSIGYKVELTPDVFLIPELKIGAGFSDETVTESGVDINLSIDSLAVFSVKWQLVISDASYAYIAPSYATMKMTAEASGYSESGSDSASAISAGLGYQFTDTAALELAYDQFSDSHIVSLGLKFDL